MDYRFLSEVFLRDVSAAKICKSMNFSVSNGFYCMEVPKPVFLSLPPLLLQMLLAGLSWSHWRCPTTCSSLDHEMSSGAAGPQVTLGAWEQLELLRNVSPL